MQIVPRPARRTDPSWRLSSPVFILVGQTLTAVGTQVTSFLLMVVDQIILGFGATAIETCEE